MVTRDAFYFLQELGYINFGVVSGAVSCTWYQACHCRCCRPALNTLGQTQPTQRILKRGTILRAPQMWATASQIMRQQWLQLLKPAAKLQQWRLHSQRSLRAMTTAPSSSSCMNCCVKQTCRHV